MARITNFWHFRGLFLTSVCMSPHQTNESKQGINLQERRIKIASNVLEKYINFWESNTENQANNEIKLNKKYWQKWEIANTKENCKC